MNSGILKSRSGEIYYELIQGVGEPLVFLHGFTLDHRMWAPQIDHFSKTNTILSLDFRGFGKSSIPTSDYSHYQDLKTILDYTEVNRAHLVGLSMGGRIALDYTLTYPQNVSSLTLLDSSLGGYKSTVDWTITVKDDDRASAKRDWTSHPVFEYSNTNEFTKRTLSKILEDYSCWHWIHPKKFEYAIPDAKDRLNEIKTKTVIGVGEHDLEYFHDIAKYMNEQITSSTYITIPDAGHMSNLDNPTFVNELIRRQLD